VVEEFEDTKLANQNP